MTILHREIEDRVIPATGMCVGDSGVIVDCSKPQFRGMIVLRCRAKFIAPLCNPRTHEITHDYTFALDPEVFSVRLFKREQPLPR